MGYGARTDHPRYATDPARDHAASHHRPRGLDHLVRAGVRERVVWFRLRHDGAGRVICSRSFVNQSTFTSHRIALNQ